MYSYTLNNIHSREIVLHTNRFKYLPKMVHKTDIGHHYVRRLEVYRTVLIHQRITGDVASLEWKIS